MTTFYQEYNHLTLIRRNAKNLSAIFNSVVSAKYYGAESCYKLGEYTESLDKLQEIYQETDSHKLYRANGTGNEYILTLHGNEKIHFWTSEPATACYILLAPVKSKLVEQPTTSVILQEDEAVKIESEAITTTTESASLEPEVVKKPAEQTLKQIETIVNPVTESTVDYVVVVYHSYSCPKRKNDEPEYFTLDKWRKTVGRADRLVAQRNGCVTSWDKTLERTKITAICCDLPSEVTEQAPETITKQISPAQPETNLIPFPSPKQSESQPVAQPQSEEVDSFYLQSYQAWVNKLVARGEYGKIKSFDEWYEIAVEVM